MKTPDVTETATAIARKLQRRGWMMATAESCTGGAIAVACTDLPGSSAWFAGALVTYIIPWKEHFLGVPSEIVRHHGVVSPEVVSAMLDGLRARCGVQAGIAVSGIAGPSGAEPGKPVGTVVAGCFAGDTRRVEVCHFAGGREAVRSQTVEHSLLMLREIL